MQLLPATVTQADMDAGESAWDSRLAAHPDPGVREGLVWAVARWSTPGVAEVLAGLASDPHLDVREAVEAVRESQ